MMSGVWIRLVIGVLGQALFSCRLIVQWLVSEREGRSVIRRTIRYFNLLGGVTLRSYAVHKQDPLIITGRADGVFICSRNLYFIWRAQQSAANG